MARGGITRRPVHCEWTAGLLSSTPILFGLPLARAVETECQARGDAHCSYTLSWDAERAAAAADPQQRVTALEAQMAAMSERLQSAYATASDLVSTEDLGTVLQRIVERAANVVRAPSHVLAVHTEPGAEPQVYSHGIDRRGALELARDALEPGASAGDSTLVVEVTSSRRHYGQLIAHYPGAVEFFPQEREMLEPLRQARRRGTRYRDGAAGVRAAPQPGQPAALTLRSAGPDRNERGGRKAPGGSDPRGRRLRSDRGVAVG